MQLTSAQWKKGIAKSHYTGMANLRNVRIDDEGVLRVINRPQKIADVDGRILEIRKGYFDISNYWYALTGENTQGKGSLYNSKNSAKVQLQNSVSGGVTFRNYFIPFPTQPNIDIGYLEDPTSDGFFNTIHNSWETLITKAQTQNKFIQQMSPVSNGSTASMVTNSIYIIDIIDKAYIKSIDGTIDIALDNSGYSSSIKDVVKVSDTAVGVITENNIYIYDLSGAEIASFPYDFSRGDMLVHLEAKYLSDNKFVILSYTENNSGSSLIYDVYLFDGVNTISDDSQKVVLNGSDKLEKTPHICGISNQYISVLYKIRDIYSLGSSIEVFEKSGSLWSQSYNDTLDDKYYGNMASYGNGILIFGTLNSSWNYDASNNYLSLSDDTIIPLENIKSVGSNGDYFATVDIFGNSIVYKYSIAEIEHTPSLVSLDDFIYYANGNSVGSIQEVAGEIFNPAIDTTYYINTDALDLPLSTKITSLADVGNYLAIGTDTGKIYFWDRTSDSFTIPVNIGESIASMKSKNNVLYIATQKAGNVYLANLSSYEKNRSFSSLTPHRFDSVVGGIEFFDNGSYFGAKVNNDPTLTGIWVYENGAWTIIGTDDEVTSISKASPNIVVYSTLNGIYEIDISGTSNANWEDDEAYIVSNMEVTGTVKNKAHSGNYQMYFDKQFKSSEYVKLYSRTTTNGQWQHIQTVTSEQLVADSGLFAFTGQLGVQKSEQIQYKIVLNTTSGLWKFETK